MAQQTPEAKPEPISGGAHMLKYEDMSAAANYFQYRGWITAEQQQHIESEIRQMSAASPSGTWRPAGS